MAAVCLPLTEKDIGTEKIDCAYKELDKGSYKYCRCHSLSGDLETSAGVEKGRGADKIDLFEVTILPGKREGGDGKMSQW